MIFKTFDSKIDKWTSKIGIFKKSFNELGTAVNGTFKSVIDNLDNFDENVGFWESLKNNLFSKQADKDWIKNSSEDIISKENINSYIAELDLDSAKDKLENMFDWDSKIKKNKATWQGYFDTCKGGNEYLIDLIKNTNDLSKLTGEDLVEANQQARASALAHNEALKAQTFSAKAGKAALQALATAGNMLAMWAISKGIEFAVTGIDNLVHSAEHCKERVDELMDSYKSAIDTANTDAKTIEDLISRYEELSKGVNSLGENLSLSTDKYAEYNQIVNQIADMFPTLIQGYTSEGNAILSLKGNVEQLRDAYQDAQQEAYNMLIASGKNSTGNDIVTNYQNQVNGQKHLFGNDAGANDIIKIMTKLTDAATPDEFRDTYNQLYNEYANIWSSDEKIQNALRASGIWDLLQFDKFSQLTPDDLSSIRHSARAVIQTYQAEIDTALKDVRLLANAYFITSPDYAALDAESKNVVSVILNSLSENTANGFENQIAVGDYVNYILETFKDNIDLTSALHDLLTLDSSKLSINDTASQIDSYIRSVADALNISIKGLTPLESKAAEALGLNEIEILEAKIADALKMDPAELKILFGLEGLDDIKKRIDASIKQLTDDHETTNQNAYAYLTDNIDFESFTQKQAEIWLDAASGAENAWQAVERYYAALAEMEAAENSLSGKLTASSASLDTFQSSIQSAYDAYAALLSGNYSASELLDSIQTLTKAAADMGETIDWEAIADEDQSLRALQEEIDRISQTYAESILNGMDLEPDSGLGKLLARIISEAHTAETAVTDMNTQLDRLISSCQTLTDFLASYNETGAVSLEQLRSLLTADQNLIAMLEVGNGQLALNEEAYEQLIEAQLIEWKEKLDNAAAAEIEALAKKEAEQATRDHAEASRSAAVLLDEETAAFGRNTSAAIADAVAKAEDAGVTQQEMQSVFDKYTNIWNAAINTYKSNFSAFLGISRSASHTASEDAKAAAEEAKRAAEEAARSAEEALDSFLSRQEAALNAGRISFQEYSDTVSSYLQAAFASGSLSAQKYWSALQSFLTVKKDSYDAAVSAVTERIDREINTLKDRQDSIAAGYQSQIDSLEKQKELLQDANEERKRHLDLQKALYEQERAYHQRTILRYSEDQGLHYVQDSQALRDAKTQVEDTRLQIRMAEIDKSVADLEEMRDSQKAAIDSMISDLENYKEQWNHISTAYEEAQDSRLAAMILGQNWEADILCMRTDVLTAFTDNYIRLQQQIADAAWESANAQIEAQKEAAKGAEGTTRPAQSPGISEPPSAPEPAVPKKKTIISGGGGNAQKLAFAKADSTLLSFHTGLKQGPVDSHSFDDDFRLVQRAGLKRNEVPAILKEGEAVATQEQIRNLADGLRLTGNSQNNFILLNGTKLSPLQPGDEMYDLVRKFNTYLENIDGSIEKILPSAVYEQNRQMTAAANRSVNSNVVNNKNVQCYPLLLVCLYYIYKF